MRLTVAADSQGGQKRPKGGGRGKNPASLNALTRKGKGRPAVPPERMRSTRTFLLENAAWNGLIDLAESEGLSVSRLIEQLSERAGWLLEPVGNWLLPDRLTQLDLSEVQALALSLVRLINRSFSRPRQRSQKRQSKATRLPSSDSARHSITLSPAGWEGLKLLALSLKKSETDTIALIGDRVLLFQRPLADWTKNPDESVMKQIVSISS